MRRLLFLLLMLTLTAGCALRSPSDSPEAGRADSPDKPSVGVVQLDDGWAVDGLRNDPVWYVWSPDTAWVAFNTPGGLWAVSADGRTEHLLAPGDVWRSPAGWWQGNLVFLEHREDGGVVAVSRPGEAVRDIAAVPGTREWEKLSATMSALHDRYLALFPPGAEALRVDLAGGSVEPLPGFEAPAARVDVARSPNGRYLLASSQDSAQPVLIDLVTWTAAEIPAALTDLTWSPVDDRWVGVGDGFLALGGTSGEFRQLPMPHAMKLRGGLAWSADGQRLALMEEIGPSPDGRPRFAPCAIWTVSLKTGEWRRLAEVISTQIRGWHPSGKYLVIVEMVGAGTPYFGLLPPDGGDIEWLPPRPMDDEEYAEQVDEQLLVVSSWGHDIRTTLYREVGGRMIPLQAGQLPHKDYLQIRPPVRSWVNWKSGPTLVVKRLDAAP